MSLSKRFPTVAVLTLLVCVACGTPPGEITGPGPDTAAAARDSAFVAALRAQLAADTEAGQFSGAVLVTRDGRTLFEGAYGFADRERGVPNTPQTQFRAGSMYKMLTAVATLQFVQSGTLRLDAPLGTYLPDYPNADVASRVTPHHLLTHTGGTGDIFGPLFTAHRLELRTTGDYLRLYGTRGPQFAPGKQHVYSNYGFILLGALVERLSGKSYDDHVAARVLAPAGMTATGTAPEDSLVPGRAVGYMRQGGRPARSCRTRRRSPTAAPLRGADTPPWGTSRASPSRCGTADSWIRRTRRCSTPGRSRLTRVCNTPMDSRTASWAAGDGSDTAGVRRG